MGRHSKEPSGPTATDRALLVAGASLVALVVLVSAIVFFTLGGDGGDDDVTAEPQPIRGTSSGAATTGPTTVGGPAPTIATPTPSATPAPAAPATSAPATSAPATSAPATAAPAPTGEPAPPAARAPTLAFRVVGEEAWIRVSAGDEILVSGTFTQGQVRTFDQPEVTVRLGNAGSVRLVVNGQPRPLGEPGQIEELTVNRG